MKQEEKVAHGICEKSLLTAILRNHRNLKFNFAMNKKPFIFVLKWNNQRKNVIGTRS